MTANVLFLDDMPERHKAFRAATDGLDIKITHVYSAGEAIKELRTNTFTQVFLDHDLSLDDIMMEAGSNGKEPSGMVVAEYIVKMTHPPDEVIVHSCNEPAAKLMAYKLEQVNGIKVKRLAFPWLLGFIECTKGA